MRLSIMIEGQMGLTWARWKALVPLVEELGFAGLFRSDHFVNPAPPADASLELVTSLTYLADHSARLSFGPLVAPVSFRDPVMLARQAAALDDLSGGRMLLGLGAGWMAREHEMFGYALLPVPERFARLEEALTVVSALLRDEEPVTFEGRYYRVEDAQIAPRPVPGPRIVVGGNGPLRTLPLAARFADGWNAISLTPALFAERCAQLDALLAAHGRAPTDVRRSMMTGVWLHHPEAERVRARGALAGTAAEIRAQLDALADAGVEEVMMQWLALDDLEGLRALAEALLR